MVTLATPRVEITTKVDMEADEVIREMEDLCQSMEDLSSMNLNIVETAYEKTKDGQNLYVVRINTKSFVPNEVVQIRVIGRDILIQGRYFPDTKPDIGSKKAKKYWRKMCFPSSTKLDTIRTTLHDDGLCVVQAVVSGPVNTSYSWNV